MAFANYTIENSKWSKYFTQQVQGQNHTNSRQHKLQSLITGGVNHGFDSEKLSIVGMSGSNKSEVDEVKINLTSPAETVVDIAKAEQHNIKGKNTGKRTIRKAPLKRASSSKVSHGQKAKRKGAAPKSLSTTKNIFKRRRAK